MKKTVSIGIPVYNEQKNILPLLTMLTKQKGDNFLLKGITVVSDGSTDETNAIVRSFSKHHKKVTLVSGNTRQGKNSRLNWLYRHITTDILITLDGDITLKDTDVIKNIVSKFSSKTVGLVGGRVVPTESTTSVGKSLIVYEHFWSRVIQSIFSGNNVHSHTGPISAGSKQLLTTVTIPLSVPDDHFLYFEAIQRGFTYRYAKDAVVFIKVPATFADFLKQRTRFLNSAKSIHEHFGSWIESHYRIPYSIKLRSYLLTARENPISFVQAVFLIAAQKLLEPFYKTTDRHTWLPVASSK